MLVAWQLLSSKRQMMNFSYSAGRITIFITTTVKMVIDDIVYSAALDSQESPVRRLAATVIDFAVMKKWKERRRPSVGLI